jgi:hypothetical protein
MKPLWIPSRSWLPRDPARRDRALGIILAALGGVILVGAWAVLRSSPGHGYDLDAYLGAAHRLAAGGSTYQPETTGGPFTPGPRGLYLYPPPLAVLLTPFTGLADEVVSAGWFWLRVALLAAGCALMPVRPWIRGALLVVAALSYPVLLDLNLGNVSTIVFALSALVWRRLDRPVAGVALGLALALRPPFAIIGAWFALRGRWRPLAWTAVAGLALIAISLPVVGVGGYLDYLAVVRNLTGVDAVPRNVGFGAVALAAGLAPPLPSLASLAGAAAAVAIMAAAMRRDREVGFVATVGASLLLAPLLWAHYLVALILPAALLAQRGRPWAILLPLLGWAPEPLLPFVAALGAALPLLAVPLLAGPARILQADPVADARL